MAFEGLSDRLEAAFSRLKSKGSLSEADVKEAMRVLHLILDALRTSVHTHLHLQSDNHHKNSKKDPQKRNRIQHTHRWRSRQCLRHL